MQLVDATAQRPPARPSAAAAKAPPPAYRAEIVTTAAELARHEPAWTRLAEAALVENVFYEPWMLAPAVAAFAEKASFRAILIFRDDLAGTPLTGLFPCQASNRYHGLPVRRLALWTHLHAVLCTPLLHRDHARPTLRAFFEWARQDGRGADVLDFDLVDAEGPFAQVLAEVRSELLLSSELVGQHYRALLKPRASGEAYLAAGTSSHHRQEFRRQRRRLAEQGRLDVKVLGPDEPCAPWVDSFLRLEARGWKGQEQTALASDPREQDYFRTIAARAHALGRLQMLGIFLDDRPVALKCNFRSGAGGFALKIAYDEDFARFSPGVQLELETIRIAHETGMSWLDSCACARHPMIDRLWQERRALQHCVLSTGRRWGDWAIGLTALARAAKRSFGR